MRRGCAGIYRPSWTPSTVGHGLSIGFRPRAKRSRCATKRGRASALWWPYGPHTVVETVEVQPWRITRLPSHGGAVRGPGAMAHPVVPGRVGMTRSSAACATPVGITPGHCNGQTAGSGYMRSTQPVAVVDIHGRIGPAGGCSAAGLRSPSSRGPHLQARTPGRAAGVRAPASRALHEQGIAF